MMSPVPLGSLPHGRRTKPPLDVAFDFFVVRFRAGGAGPAVAGFGLGREGRVDAVEVVDLGATGAGDRVGAIEVRERRRSVVEDREKGRNGTDLAAHLEQTQQPR